MGPPPLLLAWEKGFCSVLESHQGAEGSTILIRLMPKIPG